MSQTIIDHHKWAPSLLTLHSAADILAHGWFLILADVFLTEENQKYVDLENNVEYFKNISRNEPP